MHQIFHGIHTNIKEMFLVHMQHTKHFWVIIRVQRSKVYQYEYLGYNQPKYYIKYIKLEGWILYFGWESNVIKCVFLHFERGCNVYCFVLGSIVLYKENQLKQVTIFVGKLKCRQNALFYFIYLFVNKANIKRYFASTFIIKLHYMKY